MNLLSILLQAGASGAASNYSGILMMVLIFVVFYFFMIRPQQKRQKDIKKQREAMKAGDNVVTSGGIYGKVKDIKETTILIEIADNVRIKVDKNSVFASSEDIQAPAK
ncbi:MAG: preprotein translocase subunit YajC [Porphyromonadaceae bacterium CG2_30_38_12]|nr:MAG: preprotein translocase subunit YajC [Porphyromonadaceae bacterium CG2_30_38_12]